VGVDAAFVADAVPAAEGGRGAANVPLMEERGRASCGVRAPPTDVRLPGRMVCTDAEKSGREDTLAREEGRLWREEGRLWRESARGIALGVEAGPPSDSRGGGAAGWLWLDALLFAVLVLMRLRRLLRTVTVAGMALVLLLG